LGFRVSRKIRFFWRKIRYGYAVTVQGFLFAPIISDSSPLTQEKIPPPIELIKVQEVYSQPARDPGQGGKYGMVHRN
jgi:hypothetical protein